MNWKKLVALLKSEHGYTGDDTLDAVVKFVTTEGIEIKTASGKTLGVQDLATAASKAVTVTIEDDNTGEGMTVTGEPEPVNSGPVEKEDGEEEMEDKMDGEDEEKPKSRKSVAKSLRAPFANTGNSSQSLYENRIKSHGVGGGKRQARFADADRAEAFGAAFRSFACKRLGVDNPHASSDRETIRKAALTTDYNQGGAFVPSDFQADLIYIVEEFGAARKLCSITNMGRDTLEFPRSLDGLSTAWIGEGNAVTESDFNTDTVTLVAKKLASLTYLSNEILNDSAVNIADQVAVEFAQAMAEAEDDAFFNGTGASTFGGFTGVIPSLTGVGANPEDAAGLQLATGDVWSEIVIDDIEGMQGLLPHYSGYGQPVFACTRKFYFGVLLPLFADRLGTSVTDLRAENLQLDGDADFQIMGTPGYFVQKMPTASTGTAARDTVPLLYGHFDRAAKMGQVQGGVQIATSEHAGFASDTFAIRATERIAVNVHDVGDDTSAGPVVGLIMEDA